MSVSRANAVRDALRLATAAVDFDESAHRYTYNRRIVVSVTQVLRAFFPHTFAHVPADVLERKRQIGQAAHLATHLHDRGHLDERTVTDAVRPYLESWRLWCDIQRATVIATEIRLVHPTLGYAGTIDKLVIVPDFAGLTLPDLKTGDPADARAHLQTAAYAELVRAALAERLGPHEVPPIRRLSLHLQPTGHVPRAYPYDSRLDFRKFKALREALAVLEEEAPDVAAAAVA
ncbi:MAG: hypothetical protein IT181_13010 [Acidobacteria bacterium]|nr:hypothetical protein [Acidobacteriota bacterium]